MTHPPPSELDSSMWWRHLSVAGHDACTFVDAGRGWYIKGAAAFESERGIAHLTYDVQCNARRQTLRETVAGTLGGLELSHQVRRMANGTSMLNHLVQPQLASWADVDLAFTPARNTIAIRRLDLDLGTAGGRSIRGTGRGRRGVLCARAAVRAGVEPRVSVSVAIVCVRGDTLRERSRVDCGLSVTSANTISDFMVSHRYPYTGV